MNTHLVFEMVGYAGSLLVAISLMTQSLLRLRIINLVGALCFVAYGLLIGAEPVAALNGLIVGIDVYYLVQMWRQKDFFTLLEVSHDSAYLRSFIEFYKKELADIFPDMVFAPEASDIQFFVLRNMVPAGLLIARPEGEQARVLVDYVIPGYRDFGVARFLFEQNAAYFTRRGIRRFVSAPGRPRHAQYLERMGFVRVGADYARALHPPELRDTRF
jgi:GNAT superfamily N-acetyltransferase